MTSYTNFVKFHDQALTHVREARDCVRHIDPKTREWQQILTLLEIAEGKLVFMEIERGNLIVDSGEYVEGGD